MADADATPAARRTRPSRDPTYSTYFPLHGHTDPRRLCRPPPLGFLPSPDARRGHAGGSAVSSSLRLSSAAFLAGVRARPPSGSPIPPPADVAPSPPPPPRVRHFFPPPTGPRPPPFAPPPSRAPHGFHPPLPLPLCCVAPRHFPPLRSAPLPTAPPPAIVPPPSSTRCRPPPPPPHLVAYHLAPLPPRFCTASRCARRWGSEPPTSGTALCLPTSDGRAVAGLFGRPGSPAAPARRPGVPPPGRAAPCGPALPFTATLAGLSAGVDAWLPVRGSRQQA